MVIMSGLLEVVRVGKSQNRFSGKSDGKPGLGNWCGHAAGVVFFQFGSRGAHF